MSFTNSYESVPRDVGAVCVGRRNIIMRRFIVGGTRKRSCLRHYATRRKVAGSIPDEVIGFFNWRNLSTAQWPCGQASNRNEYQESSWGVKGGRRGA
jgi:hypothetical protein